MEPEDLEPSPGPHCPMISEPHTNDPSQTRKHSSSCYSHNRCIDSVTEEVLRINTNLNITVKANSVCEFESFDSLDGALINKNLRLNLPSQNDADSLSNIYPICRICHQAGDEQEPLISPCRCSGSLQYIHYGCLMKWLEVSTKKNRKAPKCELCHFQYHRHKKFKFHHWRFPRISQRDKVLHIVFLVNLVIMISCAVATVMCFLSDKGRISKFPRNKVELTAEEIITLSCGVFFFLSFFIAMTVQIKAKHTIYQLFMKCVVQNMEWEIDEYDKSKDSLYTKQQVQQKQPAYI